MNTVRRRILSCVITQSTLGPDNFDKKVKRVVVNLLEIQDKARHEGWTVWK